MYYFKRAMRNRIAQDARKSAKSHEKSLRHSDPTTRKAIDNICRKGKIDARGL